ncbi:hypothetical protein J1N35_018662 [Gossypium stocksii]|uniref:Uncharacterized protein n=1 Tax=Gossypium stocksii TaxID=47602 RepID=A0A9D4A7B4_9ROSI|nr:hypothetical protein J1N35_018662 [Gossypium stocksii]
MRNVTKQSKKVYTRPMKRPLENSRMTPKRILKKLYQNGGPLDLSRVDFNYLSNISAESLNFNVYHSNGEEWETFQRKWKQSSNFFIPITPEVEYNKEGPTNV